MKRSEINVGDELYFHKRRDWYQSRLGSKAVVVALWAKDFAPRSGRGRYEEVPAGTKGAGILVDLHRGTSVTRTVVPSSHLRGPYEQTLRELQVAAAERREVEAQIRDVRQQRQVEDAAVVARAKGLGFGVSPDDGWIQVKAADLARLLDAFEATAAPTTKAE